VRLGQNEGIPDKVYLDVVKHLVNHKEAKYQPEESKGMAIRWCLQVSLEFCQPVHFPFFVKILFDSTCGKAPNPKLKLGFVKQTSDNSRIRNYLLLRLLSQN
jgi:hypothetical protein